MHRTSHSHHYAQQLLQQRTKKQVFRVKRLVGLPPQLELLAVFSQDRTTCQNNATTYTENMSTHSFTLNSAYLEVVPSNLASHAHVILTNHAVFLHFKTWTQLRML